MIVERALRELPISLRATPLGQVIATNGSGNQSLLKRVSMYSPTRAIHGFTLRIIGSVLVIVGTVSLWRGETPVLGVGILVGLLMLIVPSIRKRS
jgi:hypothetical protein